jgi:hypothetical protein
MRLSHAAAKTRGLRGEHVIVRSGLMPVMWLAERCGLERLAGDHVRVGDKLGANTGLKIESIVAGMGRVPVPLQNSSQRC